jgi:hypothetical protein
MKVGTIRKAIAKLDDEADIRFKVDNDPEPFVDIQLNSVEPDPSGKLLAIHVDVCSDEDKEDESGE